MNNNNKNQNVNLATESLDILSLQNQKLTNFQIDTGIQNSVDDTNNSKGEANKQVQPENTKKDGE